MIQTEKRLINGHEWQVTQWPGRHALRMQTRLAKIVGPAVAKAADGLDRTSGSVLESELDVGGVVSALVDRLDEQVVDQLVADLLNSTRIDGKEAARPEVFDVVFAGNLGELYQGLAFVIEVNFGSLFTAARTIIGGLASAREAEPRAVDSPAH